MVRDREEWRRPWGRESDSPWGRESDSPWGRESDSPWGRESDSPWGAPAEQTAARSPWAPPVAADEPTEGAPQAPAVEDDTPRALWTATRPMERGVRWPAAAGTRFANPAGTDTEDVPADRPDDDGEPAATRPLGPLPQPPPSAWGADNEGPGSPVGSIRPPDTTGTVDAPPRPPRRPRSPVVTGLVGALIGGVIGTAATLALVRLTPAYDGGGNVRAPVVQISGGQATGSVVSAVAQAVTPSVVRIDIITQGSSGIGSGTLEQEAGLGSGVIYRSDGYILTNNHVVEEADVLRVRLSDGETHDAEVVGTDALNDLAVLRIDRTGLPAINIRQKPPLVVGETAIAIGSPFGLDASVTAGVVSAVNREIQVPGQNGALVIPAVIQTDAAINPGNSGGALVDAEGRLIGINTAILSGSGGSQGVGFAIPVDQAVASADELVEKGYVEHPLLGITGTDVPAEMAQRLGIEQGRGALVDSVQDGTAAADAGLESDNVILSLNGSPIESMSDLVLGIRQLSPGDRIELDVLRDGKRMTLSATLGERPR